MLLTRANHFLKGCFLFSRKWFVPKIHASVVHPGATWPKFPKRRIAVHQKVEPVLRHDGNLSEILLRGPGPAFNSAHRECRPGARTVGTVRKSFNVSGKRNVERTQNLLFDRYIGDAAMGSAAERPCIGPPHHCFGQSKHSKLGNKRSSFQLRLQLCSADNSAIEENARSLGSIPQWRWQI
jgi:hypothetical protein